MQKRKSLVSINTKTALKKIVCFVMTFVFVFSLFTAESLVVSADSMKTPKITSVSAKSSSSVKITWGKVKGISGYIIYQKNSKGEYKKVAVEHDEDETSYTLTDLKPATKYCFKVRTYKVKNGAKTYSSKSSAKSTYTKPSTPKITSITAKSSSSIQIKWTKVANADRYAIYQKSGNDYVRVATIKSGNTTSYTLKGLPSDKKYTFVMRAYIQRNGDNIYSSKSTAKTTTLGKINHISIPSIDLNVEIVLAECNQHNTDLYDICCDMNFINENNPVFFGHSTRSLSQLYRIRVGDLIYFTIDGKTETYKVTVSEKGKLINGGVNIEGVTSHELCISNKEVPTLHFFTCHSTLFNPSGRWIVLAEKI